MKVTEKDVNLALTRCDMADAAHNRACNNLRADATPANRVAWEKTLEVAWALTKAARATLSAWQPKKP